MYANEHEFRDFYDRHCQMAYRVCFMYMKNRYDAEDAMQVLFTKLIEKRPSFVNIHHEKAWIVTTASNICKSLLRRHYRRDVPIDELLNDIPSCENENCEILSIIMNLPHNHKSAIFLYYYEGYSCSEIANMLKTKESTVRSYLRRGREKLRKYLGGNLDEK